jgi:hypothetical protein
MAGIGKWVWVWVWVWVWELKMVVTGTGGEIFSNVSICSEFIEKFS